MTVTGRIEINPQIMLGKPVVRGTRIPVELILRKLSEGATDADLLGAFHHLSREDSQAVIRYADKTLAHKEVVYLAAQERGETARQLEDEHQGQNRQDRT